MAIRYSTMVICSISTQEIPLPARPMGQGCSASGSSARLAWPHWPRKERSSIGGPGEYRIDQTSMLLPGASASCMTTTLRPHAASMYSLLLPSREQKLERSLMKLLKVRLFSCVVGAMLIALLLAPTVAQAQAAPWSVVPSPSPGSENELNGVASVSANDVWAVGDTDQQTLTEHWNGTAWSVVASPNASTNDALLGVAAVSTKDVWAVGKVNTATPPLIEHWNGTSWRLVKAPRQVGFLNGVTAVSTNDVWAVGDFVSSGVTETLIEHWNGHKRSVVSSPNVAGSVTDTLQAAAAVSSTDD